MYIYVHVYMHTCACLCMRVKARECVSVLLCHSLTIPLKQGLSLNLGLLFSPLSWKPKSPRNPVPPLFMVMHGSPSLLSANVPALIPTIVLSLQAMRAVCWRMAYRGNIYTYTASLVCVCAASQVHVCANAHMHAQACALILDSPAGARVWGTRVSAPNQNLREDL